MIFQFHFAYPTVQKSRHDKEFTFAGCGRYISSDQDTLNGYHLAPSTDDTPGIGEAMEATARLAHESLKTQKRIYEIREGSHKDKEYLGPSRALAYLLAQISCSRNTRLKHYSGNVWCTGTIDITEKKWSPCIGRVIGFKAKLQAFLAEETCQDRLFIAPASNLSPLLEDFCREKGACVELLDEFSSSKSPNFPEEKTILKVFPEELPLLINVIFELPPISTITDALTLWENVVEILKNDITSERLQQFNSLRRGNFIKSVKDIVVKEFRFLENIQKTIDPQRNSLLYETFGAIREEREILQKQLIERLQTEQELEKLTTECERLQYEMDEKSAVVERLHVQEKHLSKLTEYTEELQQQEQELEKQIASFQKAQNTEQRIEVQLQQVSQFGKEILQALSPKLQNILQAIETLKHEIAEAERDSLSSKEEHAILKKRKGKIEIDLKKQKDLVTTLTREVREAGGALDEVRESKEHLKTRLKEHQAEFEQQELESQALRNQILKSNQQIEVQKQQIIEQQKKEKTLTQRIAEIEQQQQQSIEKNSRLEKDVKQHEELVANLNEQGEQLSEKLEEVRKIFQHVSGNKEKLDQELAERGADLQQLQTDYQTQEKQYQECVQHIKEQQQEFDKKQEEARELQENIKSKENQLQTVQEENAQLEENLQQLNSLLNDQRKMSEKMTLQREEINEELKQIAEQSKELKKLEIQHRRDEKKLRKDEEELEAQYQELLNTKREVEQKQEYYKTLTDDLRVWTDALHQYEKVDRKVVAEIGSNVNNLETWLDQAQELLTRVDEVLRDIVRANADFQKLPEIRY